MAKTPDDLSAVRSLIEALKPFDASDQERIIRWAREKLGLAPAPEAKGPKATPAVIGTPIPLSSTSASATPDRPGVRDVRTFVEAKTPKNDKEFAATVAYYYQFEAPPENRKTGINAEDLREACRLAQRPRLQNPGQTLRNALHTGYFDRNDEGNYVLNSVGENLVAMTLPGGERKTRRVSVSRPAARKSKRTRK
ncbi:MAG: hypothetical protein L0387_05660 [Acidobacteria bacterium]|nr:hypothetical protein [Acidobacteriota bacterium]